MPTLAEGDPLVCPKCGTSLVVEMLGERLLTTCHGWSPPESAYALPRAYRDERARPPVSTRELRRNDRVSVGFRTLFPHLDPGD